VADLPATRFYAGYVSTKTCPLLLIGQGRPALLIDGAAKPFDATAFSSCLAASQGYTMGFNAAARAQSVADAIAFLRQVPPR
jgi:hypothetical protein